MKIKDGFLLRTIADTHIVVPVAERVIEFKGMVILNDVSAHIWRFLETERERSDVADYLVASYGIDKATAEKDSEMLLKQMEEGGFLDT